MGTQKKNQWVILEDENGTRKRYNLASMTPLNISEIEGSWATGISLEQVYLMPRSKKVILETYSIWENPKTHSCYGTNYRIADADVIAQLAEETQDDRLMALVAEGEDK